MLMRWMMLSRSELESGMVKTGHASRAQRSAVRHLCLVVLAVDARYRASCTVVSALVVVHTGAVSIELDWCLGGICQDAWEVSDGEVC
jgi:hypothetical protein